MPVADIDIDYAEKQLGLLIIILTRDKIKYLNYELKVIIYMINS